MSTNHRISVTREGGSLAALVITYNSRPYVESCIAALRKHLPEAHITVIDNASSDGTDALLAALPADTKRSNPTNQMLSREWNRFAREVDAEYLMFVNPDVTVHNPRFIDEAVLAMDADPAIAVAARVHSTTLGSLFNWHAPVRPGDRHVFRKLIEASTWGRRCQLGRADPNNIGVDYADGCCMIIRRSALLKLGGFSEELPLYFNDAEFSIRALDHGCRIFPLWNFGDGNLTHLIGASSSPVRNRPAQGMGAHALAPLARYAAATRRLAHRLRERVRLERLLPQRFAISRNLVLALDWIDANSLPGAGIRLSSMDHRAYPEVTGYLIPTLLQWGDRQRASDFARWLVSIQQSDGCWLDPDGRSPYTFDTGQILKGLCAVLPILPEVEPAIRRGCDWMLSQIEPSGRVSTPDTSAWQLPQGRLIPDKIHLYALSPLRFAAEYFSAPRYEEAVQRALSFYLSAPRLVQFDTLSHFHAYVIEALVDLGQQDAAAEGLIEIQRLQRRNGAVPAYRDVGWVCPTGVAQYAVAWYKLGDRHHADRAFRYLCRRQNSSGGFFGAYGHGANYFPNREISWAVKYFLDAFHWHIRSAFDDQQDAFPATVGSDDLRALAVKRLLGNCDGLKVLDAGCGKGRFIRALQGTFPTALFWGLDVSDQLLRQLPEGATPTQGTLLSLPFPDATFDRVFSIEALEHCVRCDVAVAELCRVLKPGGRIVIVDKNVERNGVLQIERWERWFSRNEVENWLSCSCRDVGSELLSSESGPVPEGLFFAWHGTKR